MLLPRVCVVGGIGLGAMVVSLLGGTSCMVDFDKYSVVAAAGGHDGGLPHTCGNGIVEPGEACDDSGESATCNADCTAAVCGDGVLNITAGELCDGEGCTNNCHTPAAFTIKDSIGDADSFKRGAVVAAVKVDGEDRFMVVWIGFPGTSTFERPLMQTYRLDGKPVESTPVDLYPQAESEQRRGSCPRLATTPSGRTTVSWATSSDAGGTGAHAVGYTLLENGQPTSAGAQTLPGSSTDSFNGCPEVATIATGETCITFQDSAGQAHLGCLDKDGNQGRTDVTLGGATTASIGLQYGARGIWPTSDGFVAAWFDSAAKPDPTGGNHYLVARHVGPDGTPDQTYITVSRLFFFDVANGYASESSGGFVGTYAVGKTNAGDAQYRLAHYSSWDSPVKDGIDVVVNDVAITGQNLRGGTMVHGPNNGALAAWSDCNLYTRVYAPDGQPANSTILWPTAGGKCAFRPQGAVNELGDLMLVWQVAETGGGTGPVSLFAYIAPRLLAP